MPDRGADLKADETTTTPDVEGDLSAPVAGDRPDEIVPEDLPKGHPGRAEAERQARAGDGFARGNV